MKVVLLFSTSSSERGIASWTKKSQTVKKVIDVDGVVESKGCCNI